MNRLKIVSLLVLGAITLVPGAWAASASSNAVGIAASLPMYLLHTKQGYLGVDIRDVTPSEVASLKLKDTHGAEITTVDHDGPAGKAGLKEHDVILQVNGQAIDGQKQFRSTMRELPPGRTITLIISRNGQQQNITAQLADREEVEKQAWEQHYTVPEPEADQPPAMGFAGNGGGSGTTAEPGFASRIGSSLLGAFTFNSVYTGAVVDTLGPQLADYFGTKPGTGLLVRSVDVDSPAGDAGLKAGDVVTQLNGVVITSRSEWLKTMRANHDKQVKITILRDKKEQSLMLTPGIPKRK
ncbi:MAG: PDZ domain-containing protein [Acidobacteriaceae bacterium]